MSTDRTKAVADHGSKYKHMVDMERAAANVKTLTPLRLIEDQKFARSALKMAMSSKTKGHTEFWTKRLQDITAELKLRGY